LRTLEIALGLLEHTLAHAGNAVVAVTDDLVNVAQKADAVAAWFVMKEAHGSESGFVQARAARGARARRARIWLE
jgi:hypothetical protein